MNSLKELHWLPAKYHVKYKILTITHKCIYGNAPAYLKEKVMLVNCNNRYSLRFIDDGQKLVACLYLLDFPILVVLGNMTYQALVTFMI